MKSLNADGTPGRKISQLWSTEAIRLIEGAFRALEAGGQLLLEPQTFAVVRGEQDAETSWYSASAGLFSSEPHFVLTERFWDEATTSSTQRFLVIDAATGNIAQHALTSEAYTDDQLLELLAAAGFEDVRLLPSLTGVEDANQAAFQVVVARKPA
ncbi:MAG TPA: hypothetical protein QF624_05540 [Dehalococcoidia bacterium]|nr:hypothetical protein [Dehalococcoidia bacterium]